MEEPIPGWIDNIYGPIGLTIGGGKGILRVMYMNQYVRDNVVPVDIVVKAVLVVIWKLGLIKYDHQHISAHTFLTVSNYKHKSFLFNFIVKFKEEYLVEYKPMADLCIIQLFKNIIFFSYRIMFLRYIV